jgi:hypothetical protein
MGQNKEELRQLLAFIDALVKQPGNEEFVAGLRALVGIEYPQQVGAEEQLSSFLRLQREKFRAKARKYYKNIDNDILRTQLIDDHAWMLWYKAVDDVVSYFNHVNLQIENIVNYYISGIDVHSKILEDPIAFSTTLVVNPKGTYSIDIDCNKDFFKSTSKGLSHVPYSKVKSLWSKIWVWGVCTGNTVFIQSHASNIAAIINIRNDNNHRDSKFLSPTSEYWKNLEDDSNYGYILRILKEFRNSII